MAPKAHGIFPAPNHVRVKIMVAQRHNIIGSRTHDLISYHIPASNHKSTSIISCNQHRQFILDE